MENNTPSFFEELQILLGKLNKAFPAGDGRKHNITLSDEGHVTISAWDTTRDGKPCCWFITLNEEDDDLVSFDDVVEALTKYASDNR